MFEGRILQCSQGHAVCEKCNAQLTECPHCRAAFAGTRNYVLEEIIAQFRKLTTNTNTSAPATTDNTTSSTNEAPATANVSVSAASTVPDSQSSDDIDDNEDEDVADGNAMSDLDHPGKCIYILMLMSSTQKIIIYIILNHNV